MRDAYLVLGVSASSDQRAIERAYRRLCRQHHPDVSRAPDAGVRMREINAAYYVLRDPLRRRAYDGERTARPTPGTEWQAAHRVWQQSSRPPKPPAPPQPDSARLKAMPGVLDFGFLRAGEIAVKPLFVRGRDGASLRARVLTRGDWLRVDRAELRGHEAIVQVTADPRDLQAFWQGGGPESARVDGWLELVDDFGSMRVPAGAILRRDAAPWWNPFARRAG